MHFSVIPVCPDKDFIFKNKQLVAAERYFSSRASLSVRFLETQIRNVTEGGLYFSLFTKEFGQHRGKKEAQRQILSPTESPFAILVNQR